MMHVEETVLPGIQNRVIHMNFYERGRYVAHNCDVRYFPILLEIDKGILSQDHEDLGAD